MNIQTIAAIASSLALAAASSITTDTQEAILYAAYNGDHQALSEHLAKAENQVGGEGKLDICFKGLLHPPGSRDSPSLPRWLVGKNPFRAMIEGAQTYGRNPEMLLATYQELRNHTSQAECEGDFLVVQLFYMKEYGIAVATKMIESGASPLASDDNSVLTYAFDLLDLDSVVNVRVHSFVDAVLARPENIELLKSKGINPIHELAEYSLKSLHSTRILPKLLAKGFTIDGEAVEKWVYNAFAVTERAEAEDNADSYASRCERRIKRVMGCFFKSLDDPSMLVGKDEHPQFIGELIANSGRRYDTHGDAEHNFPVYPELEKELQDCFDEACRCKGAKK